MYKKLFAFCGLFAILSQNLNANWEYVIDIPKVLSPDFQEEAYKIVSRYRFPTILNPEIQAELPQTDLDDIVADEPRYISRRLKAINDGIEVHPIPKSLYQLLAFKMIVDDIEDKSKPSASNSDGEVFTRDNPEYLGRKYILRLNDFILPLEDGSTQRTVTEACQLFTEHQTTQSLYWNLNGTILGYVATQHLTLDNIRDLTCSVLIALRKTFQKKELQPRFSVKTSFTDFWNDLNHGESLIDCLLYCAFSIFTGGNYVENDSLHSALYSHEWVDKNAALGGVAFIHLLASQNASIMELIEECVMNEAEDPRYVLYRGAPSRFDSELATKFHISFSDGLFGGVINDLNSGNALEWSLKRRLGPFIMNGSKLWKISLDRRRLLNGEFPVFIPPAISLLATFGSEEFHHPKTKILQLMPDKGYNGFDDSSNGMENSNGASIAVSPTLIPEYFSENKITIDFSNFGR